MTYSVEVIARQEGSGWSAEVWIQDEGGRSRHRVTVSEEELLRYGRGRSAEELVRASVEFLLKREPPSSILPEFELSAIESYFPEFEEEV